jgi:hypothetical protein
LAAEHGIVENLTRAGQFFPPPFPPLVRDRHLWGDEANLSGIAEAGEELLAILLIIGLAAKIE